jgi:Fe-S oxidoreductase
MTGEARRSPCAFARLLNQAGVTFAILGNKEKNSGDTPRRLGNEFLFQELAAKNIEEFEKNDVRKIVTIDPHAYNILKMNILILV